MVKEAAEGNSTDTISLCSSSISSEVSPVKSTVSASFGA